MDRSHALFDGLVGRNRKGCIIKLRDHKFTNQANQDQKNQDPAQDAKDRSSLKRMEDKLMKGNKRRKKNGNIRSTRHLYPVSLD